MKNFPKRLLTSSQKEVILDSTRLLLAFKQPATKEAVSAAIKDFNLVLEEINNKRETMQHWNQINHTDKRYWVRSASGKEISEEEYLSLQNKLNPALDWIGPVYNSSSTENPGQRFCPLPNVILMDNSERLRKIQNEIIKKYSLHEVQEKSKYLSKHRYIALQNPMEVNAYQLRDFLKQSAGLGTTRFENMPMIKPLAATIPNDTLWADQWNMTQINAPDAWDIATGSNAVVICILDEGCDLTHPDLNFSEDGINLGTMLPTGAPTGNHGTACAGIAAASFNNNEGVAGLAGNCLIMPVAFDAWTDVEVANGINYASTNGAQVISMSFGWDPWDPAIIDPEIQNAFDNDVVMCVATHNHDGAITYPATNPLVMAVGASSTDDNRKTTTSPDGENWWGSDFGDVVYNGVTTGVAVVAPGVLIPTTDRQGADGYIAGNYVMNFNGTSSATPLVAGFAALIRSQYPSLTNIQVRNIIERTVAKVGILPYAEVAAFANGTRNEEMGYGRIDAFRGLDLADVMIKDWSGDDGTEPSSPPSNNFWSYSDIVVRITDDNLFNPDNPSQSKSVERGQTNYIYVRVTNNGPNEARNVTVDFRITPYVGLQFVYPDDWTLSDGMHVQPTPVTATFASIASGSSVIAKFTISADQTDTLYGWEYDNPWHPCLLALVTSDNDYAFASSDLSFGNLVLRKNNIAQRNLSVIDVLASASAKAIGSPFVAGNKANNERSMHIHIDRSKIPAGIKTYLSLDDDGSVFPMVQFGTDDDGQTRHPGYDDCKCGRDRFVFIERTRIKTSFGCCDGVMTLERGSAIDFICGRRKNEVININGGNLIVRNGKRLVEIIANRLSIEMEKQPGELVPMSVQLEFPAGLPAGSQYALSISQKDSSGKTVGGSDFVYVMV